MLVLDMKQRVEWAWNNERFLETSLLPYGFQKHLDWYRPFLHFFKLKWWSWEATYWKGKAQMIWDKKMPMPSHVSQALWQQCPPEGWIWLYPLHAHIHTQGPGNRIPELPKKSSTSRIGEPCAALSFLPSTSLLANEHCLMLPRGGTCFSDH